MSQSELARQVSVTQGTIAGLLSGRSRSSAHLHRIARVLGTTPAYLAGETDDPDKDAPPPPPARPPRILMEIVLPPERALASMFSGLLRGLDPELSVDEKARLLAKRLPIGLSQLRDLEPEPSKARADRRDKAEDPEARPMPEREPIR